jgi:hypothetical protein
VESKRNDLLVVKIDVAEADHVLVRIEIENWRAPLARIKPILECMVCATQRGVG